MMAIRSLCLCGVALGALACSGPVSEADAASARIHHDIAVANLDRGDMRGALRELLVAVDLDPQMPEVHYALGLVYHAMHKSSEALEHYEKALALKPNYSEAHNDFGALLIDLGRYDDAIEHFKKALGDILYATPSLAEGNLGWAYYKKGDVEQARQHLRNAVAQNPKFCRGYEWLARIGVERGDAAEAVANVKRFEKYCLADAQVAKTLDPEYVREMHYYLGVGYQKQGDREGARRAFASCAVADTSEYGSRCMQSLHALE
jgi:type IV pilus assembly protein PilF